MAITLPSRTTPPHILTLVIATGTAAASMNMFLPSLPGMAVYFNADYGVTQLAVSLYLVAVAVLQLGIGPASDRFGRRPVMLTCFGIFITATFAALFAPNITVFLLCRILQAFSAAGIVLSRAIVRDTVGVDEAASRIGYITMGMTLAPMLGPFIGGLLDEWYGWQATFGAMLVFGIFTMTVIYLDLGETNHGRSTSVTGQLKTYPELFSSRRFWGYTATAAMASGSFYAFLGGGPYVATEILGLTSSQYGTYFILISSGYMFGNFLSGRFSRRFGVNRMMLCGNIIASGGLCLSLLLFAAGYLHPLSLFGPSFLVGIGNGMTMPNGNAGIVTVRPHLAGSASGLGGALQIGGGAILSVAAGALLSEQTGPYPLIWVMLASSVLAVVASLYVIHVARQVGDF